MQWVVVWIADLEAWVVVWMLGGRYWEEAARIKSARLNHQRTLNRPSARDSFAYYFPFHQHHHQQLGLFWNARNNCLKTHQNSYSLRTAQYLTMSLTDWQSVLILEHTETFVNFETFHQSDGKTCPDQQKDNKMIFVKNFRLISQHLSMYLLDHSLRSGLGGACDQITASDRSFLHLPSNPLSSQLEQLRSRFNWRQCNLGEQIVNKNNLAISWSSNTLNNEHDTSGNTSDHYDVSLSLLVLLLRIFSSWLVAASFNL